MLNRVSSFLHEGLGSSSSLPGMLNFCSGALGLVANEPARADHDVWSAGAGLSSAGCWIAVEAVNIANNWAQVAEAMKKLGSLLRNLVTCDWEQAGDDARSLDWFTALSVISSGIKLLGIVASLWGSSATSASLLFAGPILVGTAIVAAVLAAVIKLVMRCCRPGSGSGSDIENQAKEGDDTDEDPADLEDDKGGGSGSGSGGGSGSSGDDMV